MYNILGQEDIFQVEFGESAKPLCSEISDWIPLDQSSIISFAKINKNQILRSIYIIKNESIINYLRLIVSVAQHFNQF